MKNRLAQIDFNALQNATGSNAGLNTVGEIINLATKFVFFTSGLLVLFYLVTGGYSYMISRGDPKAIDAAKNRITYALIGFVVIFTAYWIVLIVATILGLTQVRQIFGGILGG